MSLRSKYKYVHCTVVNKKDTLNPPPFLRWGCYLSFFLISNASITLGNE